MPALERRERRQNQVQREVEKAQQEKQGKKPFYLTLNDEGQPYGAGKPAWIAEVNKLAKGLDPSCTHIRKQTFEDVQTFKDRLNENFDYSGTLNEDYLRGLMGRAVTKKRGELIAFIRRNRKQPLDVDEEIWERLEKLAYSNQTVEKSEQGRHTNACRRTFGRTGSLGVSGVREKLCARLKRSPDPDEILEEMQHDTGYGGQKGKVQEISAKKERTSEQDLSAEENIISKDLGESSNQNSMDTSDSEDDKIPGKMEFGVSALYCIGRQYHAR